MNDVDIGKAFSKAGTTNWKRVRAKPDAALHRALVADPDARPTDEAFWVDAKVVMPARKAPIKLRLDAGVSDPDQRGVADIYGGRVAEFDCVIHGVATLNA